MAMAMTICCPSLNLAVLSVNRVTLGCLAFPISAVLLCLPQLSIMQWSFGHSSSSLCFRCIDQLLTTELSLLLGISPIWSSMFPCAEASSPPLFYHSDELQLGHWLTPLFVHTQGLEGCVWRPDACSPSLLVCKYCPEH